MFMLPPPLPVKNEDTVVCLLRMASTLDLSLDNAYQPFPHTSINEAIFYLRKRGRILLQGGVIYYGMASGSLHARVHGRQDFPSITFMQALRLLKANYLLPQNNLVRRNRPKDQFSSRFDTIPCAAPEGCA